MPITRVSPEGEENNEEITLDVFHIQENIEVYDGTLALAIDHLMNHIKTLISLAYLPGSKDLDEALKRHPRLRRIVKDQSYSQPVINGRTPEAVLLSECQRLLQGALHIAQLASWPESVGQARAEFEVLRREIPFLDFRYDNDPFPSDAEREG
jgi:hypothetical protein